MTDMDRITNIEKEISELKELNNDLAELIDKHQEYLQRTIVELTEHLFWTLEPKMKKLIRDEFERISHETS